MTGLVTGGLQGAFLWSPLVAESFTLQSQQRLSQIQLEAGTSSSKQEPKAGSLNYIKLMHTCRRQHAFISGENWNQSFDCTSSIQDGPAYTSPFQTFQQITAFFFLFFLNGYAYSQIKAMITRPWLTGMSAHAACCHGWGPQGTTNTWYKMAGKIMCGMLTAHMLTLDLWPINLQRFCTTVLHVFSVHTDDYFQSCKVPDLKISWQAPWVHDVLHCKSIPFFQDVAFKYRIYKRYQPLMGLGFFFLAL